MAIPNRPIREQGNTQVLQAPSWLSKGATEVFNQLALIVADMKVAKNSDTESLAILSDNLFDYHVACKSIEELGLMMEGRNGTTVRNPAFIIKSTSWRNVQPLLTAWGLTPSARAAMKIGGDDQNAEDPLTALLSKSPQGYPVNKPH